jgi:Fur family peroxide stress response transcriptional regulator
MIKERRHSKQREHIYRLVTSSKSHPSAEDVYSAVKEHIPAISLGTVYRNLRLLVEEGKLREVQVDGSTVSRFDGMTEDHEHFICTGCGTILDILPSITADDYHRAAGSIQGGSIMSHKLSYFGLCRSCIQKQ